MPSHPTQLELSLPLLESIRELGGRAKAGDVIEHVSDKLRIDPEIRSQSFRYDPDGVNRVRYPWRRTLHWVRMNLIERGLVSREHRGIWELTEKGGEALHMAAPGVICVVYESANGTALWASAETAVARVAPNSVNLLFSSPPYPLNNPRAYGNKTEADHIQWLVNLAKDYRKVMVDDGSLMLNMGSVWQPGQPTQSVYEERILLGLIDDAKFSLCQKLHWHNPSKIVSSPWVTIRRERINPAVEAIYWLGKQPRVKADNRAVLTPYKPDMMRRLTRGKRYRAAPSGHLRSGNLFAVDNGGAIPHSLIESANTVSNSAYMQRCRAEGLPIHPARFPEALPEFAIKLTTEPGDCVADFMAGSNTVGAVAERLGRRWISGEKSLLYAAGSRHRFDPAALLTG